MDDDVRIQKIEQLHALLSDHAWHKKAEILKMVGAGNSLLDYSDQVAESDFGFYICLPDDSTPLFAPDELPKEKQVSIKKQPVREVKPRVKKENKQTGILCPSCKSDKLKVLETRKESGFVRRRHKCLACEHRFNTKETIEA